MAFKLASHHLYYNHMRYDYREGVKLDKKKPKWPLWLVAVIGLAAGAYYAANNLSAQLVSMPLSARATPDATMQKMQASLPGEGHLYVPQLNVDLPIDTPKPDKQQLLTVKAAYFKLGSTPWETREQSVFYNLDKLQVGDELYLDHQAKRYAFVVQEVGQAEVHHVQPADKAKLILVPVDGAGELAKNSIVVAELKGMVAQR